MSIYDLEEKKPGVTPFRHPKPKVVFDEECFPVDTTGTGPRGKPILMDWDLFEDMLIGGKFENRHEAVEYCRRVYTLVYDENDEDTHWSDSTWIKIRRGLFPEALAALEALPYTEHIGRPGVVTHQVDPDDIHPLLKAGKCGHNHKIRSMDDLASVGPDSNGRPRWGCIHCRRRRSREQRERARLNKKEN